MNNALRQISSRVASAIVRGVVSLVDDSTKAQILKVELLAQETRERVERIQQYGFTSHPFPGAEVVALGVGGNRDHTVIIAVDDRRYRLKGLAGGEVALYDDQGQKLVVTRTGVEVTGLNITLKELNPGSGKITLDANEIELNGGTSVTVTTPAVTLNAATSVIATTPTMTLTATAAFQAISPSVDLGGVGGPAVGRVGDPVDNGMIDAGSSIVRSA